VNSPRLDQQVAIVTGGAGGIGSAICRRVAALGAQVWVADVAGDLAEVTAAELTGAGHSAVAAEVDVTSTASVTRLVEQVLSEHERVDVLVNCAGFPVDRPLTAMTDEDWSRVIDVSLFGSFAMCRAVAPSMIERRYGRIVNLSSRAYLGNPGQANYSAAKAGVIGLTKALAKELGRHGITVNAIAPGMVETAMVKAHPKFERIAERAIAENAVKRLGTPDDVAHAAVSLASPQAGFISGDVVHVSGGRFG
jgi:3-oxoacyl-[acyl-carrier protein] reductase